MKKLFGTDGVRDIAGTRLTCELAMRIGQAAAEVLTAPKQDQRSKVVIGKDTRASSDMLEQALAAGLCSMGVDVVLLGVIPTPAVAYLCKKYEADAGVVISASHNPFEHNGIKIFGRGGHKLNDEQQEQIELRLEQDTPPVGKSGDEIGRVYYLSSAVSDYVEYLAATTEGYFTDFKIVIDAANGAASATVAQLVKRLAIPAVVINDAPDGRNINCKCGSTDPEGLAQAVLEHRARLGFAFDGDADRVVVVDERGELVDGDRLIAIFAAYLKEKGALKGDKVAVTVMSNLGLIRCLKELGIETVITPVGDRNVLEAMEENGLVLGGEQSGHIILREFAGTGDGQLAMVFLLHILREKKVFLSRLASMMTRFPQVMINVRVKEKTRAAFSEDPEYLACRKRIEEALAGEGRVLIRPSGTEPILRIMVECPNMESVNRYAMELAEFFREFDARQ